MIILGVILLGIDIFQKLHCNLHIFLVADEVLSCFLGLNERQKNR